ncbi:MAG TPA: caspase family protein [Oculatellaceae cyanobacterium]|jgi:hypothetical protein
MPSRRHFLQFASSTLATFGLSHLDITQQGNRYGKVLAQNTPRKLALLVGINTYPNNERFSNLNGCVTDVDLQEALLIHRFGFNKKDILRLTSDATRDKLPTRSNILQAFEDHLINQAKTGDVVVFHFSGHGSQLAEIDPCRNIDFNSTLVPADETQNGVVQDIMGRTLFLLMSRLNTENVTAVLDSCHSGGGTRGNYRIRSITGEGLQPSPEEIAYQKSLMEQLKLSPEELARRRCAAVAKGVVIAATQPTQEAKDEQFNGFSAGAFTYLLTQYLWQSTDNVGNTIEKIKPTMTRKYGQEPLVDGNKNTPLYFINKSVISTDAVITQVQGEQATLWLGGIDNQSLDTFSSGATFTAVNSSGQPLEVLELTSRSGLIGKAKIDKKSALQPGILLQESSRVIPPDLKLSIGLAPSLGNEAKAVKEALLENKRLQLISAQSGNIYPQKVDYIFGRMTSDIKQQIPASQAVNLPSLDSVGLFSEGLEPVAESFGKPGESVTAAVARLQVKFKSLIAGYLIRKTLNAKASNLAVKVSLNLIEEPSTVLAMTGSGKTRDSQKLSAFYPNRLPLNKLFQFQVTNHSPKDLYIASLLIDSTGDVLIIFPYHWSIDDDSMRLAPEETKIIGSSNDLKLKAIAFGSAEAVVIVSRNSLKNSVNTLKALAEELKQRGQLRDKNGEPVRSPIPLSNPIDLMEDLLGDLRDPRGGGINKTKIDASNTATLSLSFDVG